MESKRYILTFEYRPEYLHAAVDVDLITLEIGLAYINELFTELRRSEATKVLFVRRTPAVISRGDYATLVNIAMNLLPAEVRLAVVDQSPQQKLIHEVIRNESKRRQANLLPFDSIKEAEKWLLRT
jgi:hypothetical protein